MSKDDESVSVEQALKDFTTAAEKLRTAYKPFDDGKHSDPAEVAVATSAPLVFVEEAKARLDVALALARDKSARRTTCLVVVFTCVIMGATVIQAGAAVLNYEASTAPKPCVPAEVRVPP
jgi:hypothetical protein